MRIVESLRRVLLRWDRLLIAGVLGLPFLVSSLLGFLWLLEHGFLLLFVAVGLGLGLLVILARALARRRPSPGKAKAETKASAEEQTAAELRVDADPEWLPREQEVYYRVRERIEGLTHEAQPWEDLPQTALEVVNEISAGLGRGGDSALNFTLPEALLLIERSAARYRNDLRDHLPFSDQFSLATLSWLWRQRRRASLLWKLINGGRRAVRLAMNPTAGILREIEQLVAGGHADYLSEQMMGTLQAVLLEEVAFSAIELYSGRLRFSDAELLDAGQAAASADRERLAAPDLPLRVLLVGQVSAGKSTLINALLGDERTETDMAPSTAVTASYEWELDGVTCHLLDSAGLDDSKERQESLFKEMREADMIIWVLKANRPARAPDLALKRRFDAWFEEHPERRSPILLAAASCVDRLAVGWPYPENQLPDEARDKFNAAVQSIANDLEIEPIPLCALHSSWNLETLTEAMGMRLDDALLVQRNRIRLATARRARGLREQVKKGGRGVMAGTRFVGDRVTGKLRNRRR